jgi:hypothetical protein
MMAVVWILVETRVMSQIYITDISEIAEQKWKGADDQLSQRVAILAIAALSLLLWTPIVLPLAALLHR